MISAGLQITEGLITGLVGGITAATLGGGPYWISYSTDWLELQLIIVDRENNDVIWEQTKLIENLDPYDYLLFEDHIKEMADELPLLKR